MTSYNKNNKDKIIELFHNVIKYGYIVRKYNNKIDGKSAWSLLEKEINKCNIFLGNWTSISYQFYTDLLELGVIEHESNTITKNDWLYHHFLLQHGRLARKECYLNRFLQIAYNAGQLTYCLKKRQAPYIYTRERIEYYVINSMGATQTYVDLNNIRFNQIPDVTSCLDNIIKLIKDEIEKIKHK